MRILAWKNPYDYYTILTDCGNAYLASEKDGLEWIGNISTAEDIKRFDKDGVRVRIEDLPLSVRATIAKLKQ